MKLKLVKGRVDGKLFTNVRDEVESLAKWAVKTPVRVEVEHKIWPYFFVNVAITAIDNDYGVKIETR